MQTRIFKPFGDDDTVVLFTKILTIDFDLKRKLTILFLFTKILTRILACKILRWKFVVRI